MLPVLLIFAGIWAVLVVLVLAMCVASSRSDADLEAAYREAGGHQAAAGRVRAFAGMRVRAFQRLPS
jgi:hypothetical protein